MKLVVTFEGYKAGRLSVGVGGFLAPSQFGPIMLATESILTIEPAGASELRVKQFDGTVFIACTKIEFAHVN